MDIQEQVKEQRLALVLNGGVSLAVWMGGVTHEIDLVRRLAAEFPDDSELPMEPGAPPASPEEQEVRRLWAAAIDGKPKLIVDVISGTSAGGLNGVFLATAVARAGTLRRLRQLWLEAGQIGPAALLPVPQGPTGALLDGAFFHTSIGRALGKIVEDGEAVTRLCANVDCAQEVSLITTASVAGAGSSQYIDGAGVSFDVDDHRRRYEFRSFGDGFVYTPVAATDPPPDPSTGPFRPHARYDFSPEGLPTLADAGRATASLPGVFDPWPESRELRQRRVMPPLPLVDDGPQEWLLDGGLLDNAPFDAVLDRVARQPVQQTWRRTVAFVVPTASDEPSATSVEQVAGSEAAAPPELPPPWTKTVPTLMTYPGEGNLRGGIDRLATMLSAGRPDARIARFNAFWVKGGVPAATKLSETAAGLLDLYRQMRADAAVREARALMTSDIALLRVVPSPDFEQILEVAAGWVPTASGAVRGTWDWGMAAADRTLRLFLGALREVPGVDLARQHLHRLTRKVDAVRNAVEAGVRAAVDGIEGEPNDVQIAGALTTVFAQLDVPTTLAGLVEQGAGILDGLYWEQDRPDPIGVALTLELIDGAGGAPQSSTPAPVFEFARFDVISASEFDVPSEENPARLLYGTRLNHLAAFADPEWRRWDWMWGRVSAARHLCTLLDVDEARVQPLMHAIATAEGYSVGAVTARATFLLSGDFGEGEALAEMRSTGVLGDAVDSTLHLLRTPAVTSPALPMVVRIGGALVASVLMRRTADRFPPPVFLPVNAPPPPPPTAPTLPRPSILHRILELWIARATGSNPEPIGGPVAWIRRILWKRIAPRPRVPRLDVD